MKRGGLRRFSFKWWFALPFSIGDIWKRLSPRDPRVHGMSYWWHGELARRDAESLFTKTRDAEFRIINPGHRDPSTSVTILELNCILMGLREVSARNIIEIGTFNGNTTVNLAANIPEDGRVVTIDLPIEAEGDVELDIGKGMANMTDRTIVGEQFREHPSRSRIEQVFGDSAKIDFSGLGGPFDLAFIDGCHDYAYVRSDTEKILSVMRPGGLVFWHDYAEMESVSRAVDEFRDRVEGLCAISGTRLAVARIL